jgi:hypothetical protein
VVSLAVAAGSYSGAGAVASYHGNDFSYDFDLYRGVRACDQESDSNKIKGGFATSVYGGETGSAADNDGANNLCGAGGPGSGTVKKHHTCEKNNLTWDCGNWQRTAAPA